MPCGVVKDARNRAICPTRNETSTPASTSMTSAVSFRLTSIKE